MVFKIETIAMLDMAIPARIGLSNFSLDIQANGSYLIIKI